MSDLIRGLRVLVQHGLAERTGLLEPVALGLVALPTDCDSNLHVNNGRYLTLMDLGRLAVLTRTGALGAAARNLWGGVVGAAEVEFLRELPLLSRFTLTSRVVGWDAKWFYFEQRFEREGRLAAVGRTQVVFRKNGRSVSPSRVLSEMGEDRPSPPLPESFQHIARISPHRVGRRRGTLLSGVRLTIDDLPGLDWAA